MLNLHSRVVRPGAARAPSARAPAMPSVKPVIPSRASVVAGYSKRDDAEANWDHLRNEPMAWYDNRTRKTNPKAPDFVRKDDRNVAIWIDSRDTPEWAGEVLQELDERRAAREQRFNGERGGFRGDREGGDRGGFRGERRGERGERRVGRDPEVEAANWELLREDPGAWYDNRSRKTNPRAPDFTRRDDRTVALWLDSPNAPEWLGEFLGELDAARAARREARPPRDGASDAERWESLRNEPEAWYDNRSRKTNPRAPDFVRKDERSVALWLSSNNLPEYLDELIAMLDARAVAAQQAYRERRASEGGDGGRPARAPRDDSDRDARKVIEAERWEALRENPNGWYDNRRRKTNPKAPDFKSRDDPNAVLWLTSYNTPPWIGDLLADLDQRQAERDAGRTPANV